MPKPNAELLRKNEGNYFEFRFADGEQTVGKLLRVDFEYNDFTYEVKSTNRPKKYTSRKSIYAGSLKDLATVTLLDR